MVETVEVALEDEEQPGQSQPEDAQAGPVAAIGRELCGNDEPDESDDRQ